MVPEDIRADPWTLDAHCDSVYMREFLKGDGLPAEMQGVDPDTFFRVTLLRLVEGNVRCLFVNVGDIGLLTSSAVIDRLYTCAKMHEGAVSICRNAADVARTVESGRLAVVMACESSFLFLGRLDLLRNWHRLGVRVANISHGEGQDGMGWFGETALSKDSLIRADSLLALQGSPSRDGYVDPDLRKDLYTREEGLTGFGRAAVEEMMRLGMVCDLSHANDATFWDALSIAEESGKGKFCCTHSNCFSLCNHGRNLTDGMMESLAANDGVMGLCFFGKFIDRNDPSLERYVDHILHALDVMGPDHVGIGSDYDGVPPDAFMAVAHPGRMGDLWSALRDAGVQSSTLEKIAHENFLRLM
ncbi:MAG TPA: membrane dipeptidase [Methanoregulaceae archaeon]|nr:membrane dipeptidase [Methanolinea sp.]MDD3091613.1 membrane dipeptidase [Methanoregulaceae archaeon]MDD5685266.1 membrane dipeptidase [Methanoregulaceae archaeon]HOP67475.1 membrane dipeptidase [Methanoregulaceae archaeon]HPJ74388.1 membrane dipeptidase [Methanoregulaceae archaeon]